jgi:hypothetical protein
VSLNIPVCVCLCGAGSVSLGRVGITKRQSLEPKVDNGWNLNQVNQSIYLYVYIGEQRNQVRCRLCIGRYSILA